MRRTYKSGSRWAVWRWAESPLLYMKRLHLLHTPLGGVMLNFISKPDPWSDMHDHPVNFISILLRWRLVSSYAARPWGFIRLVGGCFGASTDKISPSPGILTPRERGFCANAADGEVCATDESPSVADAAGVLIGGVAL